jgi:hypothetical protein
MKTIIKLLLLVSISTYLYASRILDYNIYDRDNKLDMVVIFDTPYHGKIKQSIKKNEIIIKLQKSYIKSSVSKKISSKLISSININQMDRDTQIVAHLKTPLSLKASKTNDSHALRFRFNKIFIQPPKTNPLSNLPTKQNNNMATKYYIVSIILFVGILFLLVMKKRITSKQNIKNKHTVKNLSLNDTQNVNIRFQKNIDDKNTVVMLDFLDQSYLVLMGKSNILLDKFTDNKPISQEDFEHILKNKQKEVNDFIQIENNQVKKSLQAYKERAASITYEDI